MSYGAEFKNCQHLSLSIIKEFGFRSGVMESRITVEVTELVGRIEQLRNQLCDPEVPLDASVLNVFHSILYGTRLNSA